MRPRRSLAVVVMTILFAMGPAWPARAAAGDSADDPIELAAEPPVIVEVDTTAATADESDPVAANQCYEERFAATLTPAGGRFHVGRAHLYLVADAHAEWTEDVEVIDSTVRLKAETLDR